MKDDKFGRLPLDLSSKLMYKPFYKNYWVVVSSDLDNRNTVELGYAITDSRPLTVEVDTDIQNRLRVVFDIRKLIEVIKDASLDILL